MSATHPRQASVVRARYWTVAAIRLACALWIAVNVTEIVLNEIDLVSQVSAGRFQPTSYYRTFFHPVAPLLLPIAVIFLSKWIVARLLPLPQATCPKCGYAITQNQNPCPECGLQLDP